MTKRMVVSGVVSILLTAMICGCAALNLDISKLKLGMTPDEVEDALGKPFAIRAAKMYENEETMEVWEYLPRNFSLYPKSYWVFFENGKVVQWGEPGDFTGKSGTAVPVGEYSKQKKML